MLHMVQSSITYEMKVMYMEAKKKLEQMILNYKRVKESMKQKEKKE